MWSCCGGRHGYDDSFTEKFGVRCPWGEGLDKMAMVSTVMVEGRLSENVV